MCSVCCLGGGGIACNYCATNINTYIYVQIRLKKSLQAVIFAPIISVLELPALLALLGVGGEGVELREKNNGYVVFK